MTITPLTARQYSFWLSFVWQETGLVFVGLGLVQLAWLWLARRNVANRLGALVAAIATGVIAWWASASTLWLIADAHIPARDGWWVDWVPFGILLAACGVTVGVTTTLYLRATHGRSAV